MRWLLVLPILIPLITAAGCLLAWRKVHLQRAFGTVGATGLLAAAVALFWNVHSHGIAASQMGGWPAPFGITLVADHLSAIMVLATGVVAFCGQMYSLGTVDEPRQLFGYHPLLQFLMMGTCGALLAGDIFNLYVWIELLLIASFVLMALGGERAQLEGTVKYVLLNILASFILLAGVGLTYGLAGTLNMADLARKLPALGQPSLVTVVGTFYLVAFGIKAAIFPLFFWLPASYHTPPIAITAIFGGLLTKVGVYALLRIFTLLFVENIAYTHTIILVLGGLTMITGVLGAVAQSEFRRLLAFHIISQIGYMLMGLGLFTAFSLGATVFFTVHIIVTKTALFFVAGAADRILGTYDLYRLGGLYHHRPLLAAMFLIPALSLGGIPPLSGFVGKLSLVQAGLGLGQYAIVVVALVVSLLTLYSMTKIWTEAFWKPLGREFPSKGSEPMALLIIPIGLLAAFTIAMGLAGGPLFAIALQAGKELADPSGYIQAVLEGGGR